MKKKIKELTIKDTIKVCNKQDDCYSCPLVNICAKFPFDIKNKELKKEIKL